MSHSNPPDPGAVAVFISYSHDTPEHMNRVGQLSDRLRGEGLDCHIDQYETSPAEGWPLWMLNHIEKADFILVVCTETYHRRLRGWEEPNKGLGAKWEGGIITQSIYESARNRKFIPVVFSNDDRQYIPTFLRGFTNFNVGTEDGYEALYRLLTNQPFFQKPALGHLQAKAPLKRSPLPYLPELEQTGNEGVAPKDPVSIPTGSPRPPVAGPTPEVPPAAGATAEGQHKREITIILVVLFVSVAAVFIFAPDSLPEYKQRILTVVCATLSGAFSFFLTGTVAVELKLVKTRLGDLAVRSTGGLAIFGLVLLWWLSPLAPVTSVPAGQPSPTPAASPRSLRSPFKTFTAGSAVFDVSTNRDGATLAWSQDDGSAYLIRDVQTDHRTRLQEKAGKPTRCVAFSADGLLVSSGSDDAKIRVWQTVDDRPSRVWSTHSFGVFDLSFLPDNRVVSLGEDPNGRRAVQVWDREGKLVRNWSTPELKDTILAVDSASEMVAISSASEGTISLWAYGDNKLLGVLNDSRIDVRGGQFSTDGQLFIAGSTDGSVRLWKVNDRTLLSIYKDQDSEVTSIAFSPDRQFFAVGHDNGTLLLWRVGNQQPVEKLAENTGTVFSIAFSDDGRVLTAALNQQIHIWQLTNK